AHLRSGSFTKLPRQIVSSRLSNQRFAAAGWTVKQKTFRRSVLKFLEKIRMQKRQLNGVLDSLERRLLTSNLFPRQLGHSVEIMFVRFRARKHLQGHSVI